MPPALPVIRRTAAVEPDTDRPPGCTWL